MYLIFFNNLNVLRISSQLSGATISVTFFILTLKLTSNNPSILLALRICILFHLVFLLSKVSVVQYFIMFAIPSICRILLSPVISKYSLSIDSLQLKDLHTLVKLWNSNSVNDPSAL